MFDSGARAAITSAFVLVGAVSACGHLAERPGTSNASAGAPGNLGGAGSSPGAGAGIAEPFTCRAAASQQFDAAHMQAYSVSADVVSAVATTLGQMSAAEQASQMMGLPNPECIDFTDLNRGPDVQVAGVGTIRGYNSRDADRGVDLQSGQKNRKDDGNNFSTAFPAVSVRAASWDLDLEKRVGEAIGDEAAASLNNLVFAPSATILRHPYWGRTQESYGEDGYLIGRLATAFTVGVEEYVAACATRFAANNIERGRSSQNAIMNEQTLREIYGRPFEMVVQDGGVSCVMAAPNEINGVKTTQNKHLLRDILKGPVEQGGFGFQGFVISDLFGMPGAQSPPDIGTQQSETIDAVLAGLDVERPVTLHYTADTLALADSSLVQDAVRRVLTQKYRFRTGLSADAWGLKSPTSELYQGSISTNGDHEALAEQVELESAVLLVNGPSDQPVLPLSSARSIAVVGPDRDFHLEFGDVPKSCGAPGACTFHFATDPALGDRGSDRVNGDPMRAVGPFAGIQAAASSAKTVTSGNSATAAANADAVVVVVGYTPADEAEEFTSDTASDRSTLDLPQGQNDLVTSVLDLMKPTVIVIESGSIVNLPWLAHANKNQATVWAGYGGIRGGAALGKLLLGVAGANFSGKMPLAWPTQAELDLTPFTDTDRSTTMGYFFGYREYDRRRVAGQAPNLLFPFGHGLSYSSFEYSNLTLPCAAQTVSKDAIINVSVDIKNTSAVDGDESAMLFVKPPPKPLNISGDRPVKELKSFARVSVKAGATVTAQLPLRVRDLRRWEGGTDGKWVIDSGAYTVLVGKNAADADTTTTQGALTIAGD